MLYSLSTIKVDGVTHTSYKPKNRAVCNGTLTYKNMPLASVKNLAVCYTNTLDATLVGGRFELEWYRKNINIDFLEDCLDLVIEYGEGKPPVPTVKWIIKSIALIDVNGVPLGLADLSELMTRENIFFAYNIKEENI